MADPPAGAPLRGIRVVEVGNYMAGPFCGMQLADLGAEVIKVEHPDGGDQVRSTAPLIDGEGSAFMRLNRNKRSVALDLKSGTGKDVFRNTHQLEWIIGTGDPGCGDEDIAKTKNAKTDTKTSVRSGGRDGKGSPCCAPRTARR